MARKVESEREFPPDRDDISRAVFCGDPVEQCLERIAALEEQVRLLEQRIALLETTRQ